MTPDSREVPLSDAELLELSSGADSLDLVKDLVLRGRRLPSFEPYACKLPSLEALSLSHNRIASLSGFSNLPLLTTLNVNNNCLSSLDGLQACHLLQCLYASNNVIRDISPVLNLNGLRVLHLVKNSLSALTSVINVVSRLDNLNDLDLSGNPVSSIPEYKKLLLTGVAERACAEGRQINLVSLDGDSLSPLDVEMAVDGGSNGGGNEALSAMQMLKMPGKESGAQQASADDQALPELSIIGPRSVQMQRPTTSSQMRPGTSSSNAHVRLVADELLNDHPVLLEYLASHVLKEGLEALGSSMKADGFNATTSSSTVSKIRSSFVNRLRGTTAASCAAESKTVIDLVASGLDVVTSDEVSNKKEANKAQLAAAESLVMGASPQETIRQLVRLCEVLIRELQDSRSVQIRPHQVQPIQGGKASAKDDRVSQLEAEVERLNREMMQLKQENANVGWLAEQYREMKAMSKK